MIHHTADDNIANVENWFKDPKSERSAHFVIAKYGTIVQMVAERDIAWHCKGKNHNSIGIEVLSKNAPITSFQEQSLAKLLGYLLETYGLGRIHVKGHGSMPGQNTECPGNIFIKYGEGEAGLAAWLITALGEDFGTLKPHIGGSV